MLFVRRQWESLLAVRQYLGPFMKINVICRPVSKYYRSTLSCTIFAANLRYTSGLLSTVLLQPVKKFLETSLPCSQQPATGPYLESFESNPHPHSLHQFQVPSHLRPVPLVISSVQVFRLKFFTHLSSPIA